MITFYRKYLHYYLRVGLMLVLIISSFSFLTFEDIGSGQAAGKSAGDSGAREVFQNETVLIDPVDRCALANNKPLFKWKFYDNGSNQPSGFQLLIDDELSFGNPIFDSGEKIGTSQKWQFPEGTAYTVIPDGTWYWSVRVRDGNNNWGSYSDPWQFVIDTVQPVSKPVKPANNGSYSFIDEIYGTAFDSEGGSGIGKVEILLQRVNDDWYWSGKEWAAGEKWLKAEGTDKWKFDHSTITWNSGFKYKIFTRAVDGAGNHEDNKSFNIFIIDRTAPSSIIDSPAENSYLNRLDMITGTAVDSDGSAMDRVEISIKHEFDLKYWSGKKWVSKESWFEADGISSWEFNSSRISWKSDTQYIIFSRGIDNAGNIETVSRGRSFMFDKKQPTLSITINGNAKYSNSNETWITTEAVDTGSGLDQISISSDGQVWGDWVPFNANKTFQLPDGDGVKGVFLRVSDRAGNIAEPAFDEIILDSTPPGSLAISINDGAERTNSVDVELSLTAVDNNSGLEHMSFSTNGITWTSWENYSETKTLTLPDGEGEKKIYFIVRDRAGNIGGPITTVITLDSASTGGQEGNVTGSGSTDKSSSSSKLILIAVIVIIVVVILVLFIFIKPRFGRKSGSETDVAMEHASTIPVRGTIPAPSPTKIPMPDTLPTPVQPGGLNTQCPTCGETVITDTVTNFKYCGKCKKYILKF